MKSIKILSCLVFILSIYSSSAQNNPFTLKKEKFNINKAREDTVGYAQAVKVGNTIYISGSTGSGTIQEGIKTAYGKIEKSLQYYHIGFENIVKETVYTTEIDSLIKYKYLRKAYYKNDYPASTWIGIKRLSNPAQIIEVEVIAVLQENKD